MDRWSPGGIRNSEGCNDIISCSGEFILDTDAYDKAIGAVLSQVQDGEERVIGYAGRSLDKRKVNYCVTRKELLSSVIVNRQCGGGKFKHVPQFCIGVQITWYRACEMTICTELAAWSPISQKQLETGAWSQWSTNWKWGMGSGMVTWPMTSPDLKMSTSWPNYLYCPISPKGQRYGLGSKHFQ